MGPSIKLVREERGISAVVAAIALVGIFAGATLSVDAGNLWQTRRNMITATDASALGQAGELAFSTSASCTQLYETILERNAGSDVGDRECTVVRNSSGTGYVVVEGRKPVSVRFGAVLGLGDTAAYSMSAAMFGFPTSARGLRPIGICNENHHIQTWLDLKADPQRISQGDYDSLKGSLDTTGDGRIDYPIASFPGRPIGRSYNLPDRSGDPIGVVHRVHFTKDESNPCGNAPGNWGWLNFDGGPGPQGEIEEWLQDGYHGDVGIRGGQAACVAPPGQGSASDSEAGCVPSNTGSLGNSINGELDAILDVPISIVIFDGSHCSGQNCRYDSWAFLGVKIRGYQVVGAESLRFFDLEFTDIQLSGVCCGSFPADTGVRSVALCAVDHDAFGIEAANRCGQVS